MRSSNAMRIVALLGAALGSLGSICNPVSIFVCESNEDCRGQGAGGRCESNLSCSFPDERCPGGRRWHSRADHDAGKCLDDGLADSGSEGDASEDGSSGASFDDSGVAADSTTSGTGAGEDADSSQSTSTSTSTSTGTTSGSSTGLDTTETGPTESCDDLYGSALDYRLCEETADHCAFNIRVNMTASCEQACAMFGSTCIAADLNDTELCVSIGQVSCDDMSFTDGICTCSRK